MMNCLPIPNTLRIIKGCWSQAEQQLKQAIDLKYDDLDEEIITVLFHREFRYLLNQVSHEHGVSRAFLSDLELGFPEIKDSPKLQIIAENLIADVSLHNRREEGITGGDFGFTITRPQVAERSPSSTMGTHLTLLVSERQFGLLMQAKLKGRGGKWGHFTSRQKKVLPSHMDYLGLLLYEYEDTQRKTLSQFRWQICDNSTLEQAEDWLRHSSFPSLRDSEALIEQLSSGEIGTDNPDILKKIIQRTAKPHFSIIITWPPDNRPPDEMLIELPWKAEEPDRAVQRIGY